MQSLYAQQVRRIDVELRSRLPHLTTRIFEISEESYVIWFDRMLTDAEHFKAEFQHDVRYATVPVEITNEFPTSFLREWPTILDSELSKDFAGLSFTNFGLVNLIAAKFPDFPLRSIEMKGSVYPYTLKLVVATDVVDITRVEVLSFCNRLGLAWLASST